MRAVPLFRRLGVVGAILLALAALGCQRPTDQAAPAATPPAEPESATVLALEGDGLRAIIKSSGAARPLPFGTEREAALRMLEAVRGVPPDEQGESADCGAEFATWADGFQVWFARGAFVGWAVRGTDAALSTVDRLRVGTTRAQLEDGGTLAEIAPSSLGVEFTAGGVAGLLASDASDAPVTHLWAGATCIAR